MKKSIAIIGAGAGGLCAGRYLKAAGHHIQIFEATSCVGGTWNSRDGSLGTAMYDSLRTNLPKEIMEFDEPNSLHMVSNERFPHRNVVLRYLEQYCDVSNLRSSVRLDTPVESVRRDSCSTTWVINGDEVFDAVIVANGHYSKRYIPSGIEGMDSFSGEVMHSREYRRPDSFAGRHVVVVGAGSSGCDISREIGSVASAVFLVTSQQVDDIPCVTQVPRIQHVDGCSFTFADGYVTENVDILIWATGYHYSFDFLPEGFITIESGKRVTPLYKQIFCIRDPTLCFVGLNWKTIPFPLFESQVRCITAIFSGTSLVPLPSPEVMLAEEMKRHANLVSKYNADEAAAIRYSHMLDDKQFAYRDELAAISGSSLHDPQQAREYFSARSLRKKLLGY